MSFIPDEEVTNYRLLSEEQRESIFARMVSLSHDVQAGKIDIDAAVAILMKPPFNMASIHRVRRVLNPGPPTP